MTAIQAMKALQATLSHSQRLKGERIAVYAVAQGEKLSLTDEELLDLRIAGALTFLGASEEEPLKPNPAKAYEILSKHPVLERFAETLGAVEENWDGSGRPLGLGGLQIPLLSRLIRTSLAWDELSFEKQLSLTEALKAIREQENWFYSEALRALEMVAPVIQPIRLD